MFVFGVSDCKCRYIYRGTLFICVCVSWERGGGGLSRTHHPCNKTALRLFRGMVNYCHKRLKKTAHIVKPLLKDKNSFKKSNA